MLIYGASGHAKVIYDCILSRNKRLNGIFDDDIDKDFFFNKYRISKYNPEYYADNELIIGIGNNKLRELISTKIEHKFGKISHFSAIVGHDVIIGDGSVILHGAIIQTSTKIGKHCIVNTNSSIDHDCVIEDFAHIAPNATLCGGVVIGKSSMIGAGSVIIPNVKIGKNVIVGAGSVVIRDISDDERVFGNPAKVYV